MKLLLAIVAAAMLTQSTAADSCAVSTLSKLLLNQNIGQCSDDSGYAFTTGRNPTSAEVSGMCASDACHNLLNDVKAMNLTECTLPIGDKIYLFADLIDFVSDQCDGDTPTPSTVTPEPATAAPTPVPTTATPAPTTAIASCTSAQLRYLLTSSYTAQCAGDTGYSFTAPTSPTEATVAAMCASESCVNLFAYVASMVTTDCRVPVGGKILLLSDLVDYVADQCDAATPTPATPSPPTTATPVTTCQTSALSALLTNQYIGQCAADSGYSFTSGTQPDAEEVAGMCASSACANLLADVEALGLSECILPIGDKIYLFRDLVGYVADQCSASSTIVPVTETPTTPAPATGTPTTTAPSIDPSPAPNTPTTMAPPTTSTPGTASPGTDAPGTIPDTDNPKTEIPITGTPTTETPEPTSPIHDAC